MKPLLKNQVSHAVTMAVVENAARMWGVDPLRLITRERTYEVSHPRFAVVFALRSIEDEGHHVTFTTKRLAALLGFECHTSVSYAYKRALEIYGTDLDFTTKAVALSTLANDLYSVVTKRDPDGVEAANCGQ